jgi:hypothetical protein
MTAMTRHIGFHLHWDEAFDDLVRQALVAEQNRLPGPSSEVWRTLVARIQIEQGLLTIDINTEHEIKRPACHSARRHPGRRQRGQRHRGV